MGLFDSPLGSDKSIRSREKYAADFEIVEERDGKGRLRQKAVYKGTWTVIRDPGSAKPRLWAAAAIAFVLAAAYFRTVTLTHMASGKLPVMVPLLAGLFPVMYLVMGVLSLPYRGGPMRRDQYMHSMIRASRSALAAGIFAAGAILLSLVCRAFERDWLFLREDWVFITLCALIAALGAAVILLLRGIDLAELPNEACQNPGK